MVDLLNLKKYQTVFLEIFDNQLWLCQCTPGQFQNRSENIYVLHTFPAD